MTISDFYKQVAKETGYPRQLVQEIMVAEIRVFIEELLSNKEHASLSIKGLFDIYLYKKHCKMYLSKKGRVEEFDRWLPKFKVSRKFKYLLNDEIHPHDFIIGSNIPLYPEEYYKNHKLKQKKPINKMFELVPAEYTLVDKNRAKRKKVKKKLQKEEIKQIKYKLPEED